MQKQIGINTFFDTSVIADYRTDNMYYSATPKCVKTKKEICKGKVILFGHNTPSDHIFAHFLLHIFGSDQVNAKMNLKITQLSLHLHISMVSKKIW